MYVQRRQKAESMREDRGNGIPYPKLSLSRRKNKEEMRKARFYTMLLGSNAYSLIPNDELHR